MTDIRARLDAVRDLGHFEAPLVEKLGAFLAKAPDEKLFRINPLMWGSVQGVPERVAIDLFLFATHAGLLEMSWGVLCPNCAGFITSVDGIRSLGKARRCSFCEVPVQGVLDDNIEVAFTVSPRVRPVRLTDPAAMQPGDEFLAYFSTSIQLGAFTIEELCKRTRDRLTLAAGASEELEVDLLPGRYAVMAPKQHAVAHFTVRAGGSGHLAELDLLAGDLVPNAVALGPGRATIKMTNRTRGPARLLFYEGLTPAPEDRGDAPPPHPKMHPYLSGKKLLTTQVFRDLFRADSVPGEAGIALRNLSLLFTDLKGSTEMYERIGDFKAFELVSRHFELLRELVRSRGGAVVKTIGDAVMASFGEPAGALDAAAAMNRGIRGINGGLELKIGIHAGPCIAVQSNEQLDYFGQTVNIAARVQGIARAGEIVCTTPVIEAQGSAEVLRSAELAAVPDSALLKGVEGRVAVHRLRLAEPG